MNGWIRSSLRTSNKKRGCFTIFHDSNDNRKNFENIAKKFETAYIYYLELRNVQSMNRKNYIKRGITFFQERIPRIPRNRGFKLNYTVLYLYRKLKRKQIQENSIITIEIKMEIS